MTHILRQAIPTVADCMCRLYDIGELLEIELPDGEHRPATIAALYKMLDQLVTAIDDAQKNGKIEVQYDS